MTNKGQPMNKTCDTSFRFAVSSKAKQEHDNVAPIFYALFSIMLRVPFACFYVGTTRSQPVDFIHFHRVLQVRRISVWFIFVSGSKTAKITDLVERRIWCEPSSFTADWICSKRAEISTQIHQLTTNFGPPNLGEQTTSLQILKQSNLNIRKTPNQTNSWAFKASKIETTKHQ